MSKQWTEKRVERLLHNIFAHLLEKRHDRYGQGTIRTFAEAMVLTRNKGVVVELGKSEFQICIVDSTRR